MDQNSSQLAPDTDLNILYSDIVSVDIATRK